MAGLAAGNKLHINWSDSSFFPWLNEFTVIDYFCDVRNPFYNVECNNQYLKMQGGNPETLMSMKGYQYQLHSAQPPLYIIRKVERKSAQEVIPLSYYYILHGVVYQAPDFMSVLSSRLEMTSHYLQECLETSFGFYKFNPSKGYHWEFNQNEERKNKDVIQQQKWSMFQVSKTQPLIEEFVKKIMPLKPNEENVENMDQDNGGNQTDQASENTGEQPAEKKLKLNSR
ncbi:mediator of RNA polymerase II transcription subunit 6 [Brachionus plicatilis]|uniref:Mediator of RNA polymerase II transcription subunit 6 n=1 Tax=Brachionus plicatilis TaxID=10195 RepID=A0A3M7P588_BRAPC|nr:mediator of RNA polymerase II transcription subunit 6 [Brachionus plicatilis]